MNPKTMILKYKSLIVGSAIGCVFLASCSSEQEAFEKREGPDFKEEKKEDVDDTGLTEELSCVEENVVQVEGDAIEQPFQLKNILAYRSGLNLGADHHARRVVINFSNSDIKLGRFEVEGTGTTGAYIIQVAFSGEATNRQKDLVPVSPGVYNAGPELAVDPNVSLQIIDGNSPVPIGETITGTGEITGITDDRVCGSVQLKGNSGLVVNASFSAPIQKDYWKHLVSR